MVRKLSSQQTRDNFGEIIDSVFSTKEPVVVEENGTPYAVLLSVEAFEEYRELRSQKNWEAIDRMRAATADLDPEEIEALVAEEIRAYRAERREAARRAS